MVHKASDDVPFLEWQAENTNWRGAPDPAGFHPGEDWSMPDPIVNVFGKSGRIGQQAPAVAYGTSNWGQDANPSPFDPGAGMDDTRSDFQAGLGFEADKPPAAHPDKAYGHPSTLTVEQNHAFQMMMQIFKHAGGI